MSSLKEIFNTRHPLSISPTPKGESMKLKTSSRYSFLLINGEVRDKVDLEKSLKHPDIGVDKIAELCGIDMTKKPTNRVIVAILKSLLLLNSYRNHEMLEDGKFTQVDFTKVKDITYLKHYLGEHAFDDVIDNKTWTKLWRAEQLFTVAVGVNKITKVEEATQLVNDIKAMLDSAEVEVLPNILKTKQNAHDTWKYRNNPVEKEESQVLVYNSNKQFDSAVSAEMPSQVDTADNSSAIAIEDELSSDQMTEMLSTNWVYTLNNSIRKGNIMFKINNEDQLMQTTSNRPFLDFKFDPNTGQAAADRVIGAGYDLIPLYHFNKPASGTFPEQLILVCAQVVSTDNQSINSVSALVNLPATGTIKDAILNGTLVANKVQRVKYIQSQEDNRLEKVGRDPSYRGKGKVNFGVFDVSMYADPNVYAMAKEVAKLDLQKAGLSEPDLEYTKIVAKWGWTEQDRAMASESLRQAGAVTSAASAQAPTTTGMGGAPMAAQPAQTVAPQVAAQPEQVAPMATGDMSGQQVMQGQAVQGAPISGYPQGNVNAGGVAQGAYNPPQNNLAQPTVGSLPSQAGAPQAGAPQAGAAYAGPTGIPGANQVNNNPVM